MAGDEGMIVAGDDLRRGIRRCRETMIDKFEKRQAELTKKIPRTSRTPQTVPTANHPTIPSHPQKSPMIEGGHAWAPTHLP